MPVGWKCHVFKNWWQLLGCFKPASLPSTEPCCHSAQNLWWKRNSVQHFNHRALAQGAMTNARTTGGTAVYVWVFLRINLKTLPPSSWDGRKVDGSGLIRMKAKSDSSCAGTGLVTSGRSGSPYQSLGYRRPAQEKRYIRVKVEASCRVLVDKLTDCCSWCREDIAGRHATRTEVKICVRIIIIFLWVWLTLI